ncbi:glycosyltransferase family 8 protein, partial [Glonium stellatum]
MQRLRRRLYHFLGLAIAFSTIASLLPWQTSPLSWPSVQSPLSKDEKYAYATFLGPPTVYESDSASGTDSDLYFTSIRLLTYQLLHSPATRTAAQPPIPFLVLALPSVPASHLSTLAAAGATIIQIQPIHLPSTFNQPLTTPSRSRNALSKLRLWQMTAYTKLLFLDANTMLLSPLDALFTDAALSIPATTLPPNSNTTDPLTHPPLPPTYLLA